MPRDGAGIFSLPANYIAITGDPIVASQHNSPLEDIKDAITASLPRNGAAAMTAALNMGSFKLTSLANGTLATDGVNKKQLDEATGGTLALAGTATAYTLTLNTAPATLDNGLTFWAKANIANTGGATTLVVTPNGGTAFASKKIKYFAGGVEVNPGTAAMVANNHYLFQYDSAADSGTGAYILVNPSFVTSPAFRAHKNGALPTRVTDITLTKVTFGTEAFDIGGYYDTATSKWTPPAGTVLVTANIALDNGMADQQYLLGLIYKNGVEIARRGTQVSGASTPPYVSVSVIDSANGTDYYEAYFYVSPGTGPSEYSGASAYTFFQGAIL